MLEGKYLLFGDCYDDIYKIRKQCTSTSVLDAMDPEALHVIVYEDKQPISCGRMLIKENGYVFDNIYVIKEKRKNKIGDFTVRLLIEKANLLCAKEIKVSCEESNKLFFESLGFQEIKEPSNFNVTGIEMYLNISNFFNKQKCCNIESIN